MGLSYVLFCSTAPWHCSATAGNLSQASLAFDFARSKHDPSTPEACASYAQDERERRARCSEAEASLAFDSALLEA